MENPIDVHIGQKIRELRNSLKMSQEQIGELIGVTFQQIQKYESGTNRISASRLYELAQIFSKPISSFFDDYVADENFHNFEFQSDDEMFQIEEERRREIIDLNNGFNRINNDMVRKNIISLVSSVANNNQ